MFVPLLELHFGRVFRTGRQPSISVDMGKSSGGRVFASSSPLRSLSTSSRRERRLPENLDGGKKPSPMLRCAIEEPILVLVAAEHPQSVTVPVDSFRSPRSGSQYDCGWAYRKHDSGRPGRASHQSGAPGEWGGWARRGSPPRRVWRLFYRPKPRQTVHHDRRQEAGGA